MPGRLAPAAEDVASLQAAGVARVLTLTPLEELVHLGAGDLPKAAQEAGVAYHLLPIEDYGIGEPAEVEEALRFVDAGLAADEGVLVHCRAGIGRSGMIAATVLVRAGVPAEEAIRTVRSHRPGAMETAAQERFVRHYGESCGGQG
jgi:protein-tyrosine phosphatase